MSALEIQLPPVSHPSPVLVAVSPAEVAPSAEVSSFELAVAGAEAAIARHDYSQALRLLGGAERASADSMGLSLRALLSESWALMYLGRLDDSIAVLERARTLAEHSGFGDIDRAEVLFRLGCARLKLSQTANAVALLTVALELCDRVATPCDRLRARILEWRCRGYQRQRDFGAARADVERALELAEGIDDSHSIAHVQFQASLVAERQGQWILARFYAEQALDRYERLEDGQNVARMLNNLGGLTFLLGRPGEAVSYLKRAFAAAIDVDSQPDAAQAISSLAQVHLRSGEVELAEQQARHALELLGGRIDFLDEIGNVQLVLGRSLLEQSRYEEAEQLFRDADRTFEQLGSVSHRAAAWMAFGDLAGRRGDAEGAAAQYRRAAEALQDFNF